MPGQMISHLEKDIIKLDPCWTEYIWLDSKQIRNLKSETLSTGKRHVWISLTPGWRERLFNYESKFKCIKEKNLAR